jgi:hypothetical protein
MQEPIADDVKFLVETLEGLREGVPMKREADAEPVEGKPHEGR